MIKIACMLGAPDLQAPTLAPYRGDLEQACRRLSELGYDGVELMVRRPGHLNGAWLRDLLDRHNLALVALCTGAVFGEDGLGLVGPELEMVPAAFERAREFVDFAHAFFQPGVLINLGRFRGPGNPEKPAESLQAYESAFQQIADYAQPRQVRLILEPVSRNEVTFFHSTQDGLAMARRVNRPNFGVMLDTYHMHREDANLIDSLHEAGTLCWHMHFSDSNRCHPGSGEIRFEEVAKALNAIGYDGYAGLEIKPWPTPDLAASNAIDYLRTFIPAAPR